MNRTLSRPARRGLHVFTVALVVVGTLVSAPTADANNRIGAVRAGPAAMPAGYQVREKTVTIKAKQLKFGIVTCPLPERMLGGGVFVASTSLVADVADDGPILNNAISPDMWQVLIANGSTVSSYFDVYAICGTTPKAYGEIENSDWVDAAPHSYVGGTEATCPAGNPMSGGPESFHPTLGYAMNSSLPEGTGWRVDVVNNSATDAAFFLTTLCGTLSGYHIVQATAANPAHTQSTATAHCGTGVPVGGGAYSSSAAVTVAVNGSYPVAGGWTSYVNNGSSSAATLTTYAVCAT